MEQVARIAVMVTFLRMEQPPADAVSLPAGTDVVRVEQPGVALYRHLYDTVGARYVWWLRRAAPDEEIAALLQSPSVSIHVLRREDGICGFYELDGRNWPDVNLSYFGLMPHAVGRGLGYSFLRHAVAEVWRMRPRAMTVNTCTADHPRALPIYLRAGFRPVRQVRERWEVPLRLGLSIPDALRI